MVSARPFVSPLVNTNRPPPIPDAANRLSPSGHSCRSVSVGKTRLVAETVQGWDRRFPIGRWLDLAPIRVLYAPGRVSGVAVL
jgi:hypothetical protein